MVFGNLIYTKNKLTISQQLVDDAYFYILKRTNIINVIEQMIIFDL